ncbi:hypothetical protein ABEB36_012787 [Hypothenemus hampei]|uniref:Uncharacterized protein n=1 Tax=Hypothenemus hampei TaxID=57062 RepID=A0ABD1E5S7_HYPHA
MVAYGLDASVLDKINRCITQWLPAETFIIAILRARRKRIKKQIYNSIEDCGKSGYDKEKLRFVSDSTPENM